MSTHSPEVIRICRRCSQPLQAGALACDKCHALVYADELERISAQARVLESKGDMRQASESWRSAVLLLPQDAKQADWIREHIRALDIAADQAEPQGTENKWANRLGPIGPIAILLAKSKALIGTVFKLKFLLSLAAFMGVYWGLYGATFGIGFALLILIHEMGHFIDIKRRGLPAEMPVFMPGLGAYVRWTALGVSVETRAAVSLAGPLAGVLASVVCGAVWWYTGSGIWAALARAGAWLNVLNLIPIWVLDGGQAALALNRIERMALLTVSLALWLLLGENVFCLVALGAGWRLFTKDLPERPSRPITSYYIAVLTLLALILRLLPGHGAGMG